MSIIGHLLVQKIPCLGGGDCRVAFFAGCDSLFWKMKCLRSFVFYLGGLLLSLGLLADDMEEVEVSDKASLGVLIEGMGSESFLEREKSMLDLWAMEEEGLELLRLYEDSSDPEIRIRAQRLISDIEMGILANTPEDVVALIRNFFKGDQAKKLKSLEELKKRGLYRQVLRLYVMEKNPEDRLRLTAYAREALNKTVAQFCKDGKEEELEPFLRRYRKVNGALIKLARFKKMNGELEEDFEKEEDSEVRFAMARVLGDVAEVKELAKVLGREDLLVSVGLMEGDLIPYIDAELEKLEPSPACVAGLELAKLRYDNVPASEEKREKRAEMVEGLLDKLGKAKEQKDGKKALLALMANGYVDEALPLMKQHFKDEWLSFLEVSGDWEPFFQSYGLSPSEPVPEGWIEKKLKTIRKKIEGSGYEVDEYLTVAHLYYQLGEFEQALAVTRPLYEMVVEKDDEGWHRRFLEAVMNRCTGSDRRGLVPVVLHLMKERAAGDVKENGFIDLFAERMLSSGESGNQMLWELLGELKEDWTAIDRFEVLAFLTGCLNGYEGEEVSSKEGGKGWKFLKVLKTYALKAKEGEKLMVLEQIFFAGQWMLDRKLTMWSVNQLLKADGRGGAENEWVEAKAILLANAGDWQALRKHLKRFGKNGEREEASVAERARAVVISHYLDDARFVLWVMVRVMN